MSDDGREPEQRDDDEDFALDLRAQGFAAQTEEEQQALLAAADQEPDDDEPEADEDDDDLIESYGSDLDAPWAPPPLQQARDFLRANPDAKLDLIFPSVYEEDRSAKLKDLAVAQGLDYFTHQRAATQAAQEFGFEQFDYHAEMHAIREEKKEWGDILGQGDALAGRIAGVTPPPSEDEDDEREPRRADLAGPARARFRRQQKEVTVTTVNRDPETGLIRELVTKAAPPDDTSPASPPPLGFDPEAFFRGKREQLLRAKQQAEAVSPPASDAPRPGDPAHERRVAFRRAVLQAGKQLAQRIREQQLPKGPQLTKDEVHYGFSDTTHQISLGLPVVACGACEHFRPPGTPSGVGGCDLVVGPIKGTDRCDRFERSRTGRALAR